MDPGATPTRRARAEQCGSLARCRDSFILVDLMRRYRESRQTQRPLFLAIGWVSGQVTR